MASLVPTPATVLEALTFRAIWGKLLHTLMVVLATLIEAVQRALLFLGSAAIHKGVDFGMMHTAPKIPHGEVVQRYVDTIVYVAFLVIYLALLYEVVAVFLPFLKPFKRTAHLTMGMK